MATVYLVCKRLRQKRNLAITSAANICNLTDAGQRAVDNGPAPAPRAHSAAVAVASAEPVSSFAVPKASYTRDRATSPMFRSPKFYCYPNVFKVL